MTEPAQAIAYEPTDTLTLTNVIGIATGEPIPPAVKPKRKYTRKAKKARAPRASKASPAIMLSPDGASTLDASQAVASVTAWPIPPVPPVSMMRSIYDLLTPPGGNQGTRILRFSERFWLLLLSALSVSIGTTAAVYWW